MVHNQTHFKQIKHDMNKRLHADDILQEKLFLLICLIQQSDEQAFSDFYDLTVDRVYSLVFRILGDKNDTEEVVCDVFAQIWQQATKYYSERGSVIGWCLLVARCRALDLYRKRKTFKEMMKDAMECFDEFSDGSYEPEKVIMLNSDNNETQKALEQLSMVQKQLLSLAFYKGLSHSEISQAIDMPLGSVKSNIRRALETLNIKLKNRDLQ
ncbi:MAG: sigma-70 family RNA polymerase sigma factor [Aliiglaciecola sp.]